MIFFEDQKIAFVFPAKTGSTTAIDFLSQSSVKVFVSETIDQHLTSEEAKAKYPALADFTFYSFFRNPVERFVSALSMSADMLPIKKLMAIGSSNLAKGVDDFINVYFERNKHLTPRIFYKPQIDYVNCLNVVALDFDNYEAELKKASQSLGVENAVIDKKRKTNYEEIGVNKENLMKWLTPYVKKNYSEDCKFWAEKFNKYVI